MCELYQKKTRKTLSFNFKYIHYKTSTLNFINLQINKNNNKYNNKQQTQVEFMQIDINIDITDYIGTILEEDTQYLHQQKFVTSLSPSISF